MFPANQARRRSCHSRTSAKPCQRHRFSTQLFTNIEQYTHRLRDWDIMAPVFGYR